MKWLVIGVLVCLAGHGQCGALKCTSDTKDPICTEERLNKDPANQISKDETQETAGVQASETAECLPGSKWESKCHKCTCSEKGLAKCVKEENCKQEVPGDPIRCKPTTQFKRGCHSCICLQDFSEDVKVLCSLSCAEASATSKNNDELPQGKECAPGTTWKSQCNECGCTQNGEYFCTRKSCLQEEMGIEMRCAPNSRWSYDCNTCWCSSNGVPACTLKGCSQFQLAITEEKDEKPPVVTDIPATKQNSNNPKYIYEDSNLVKPESDLEYYDQIFNDGNHEIDDPDESHEELINLLDRDEDYVDRNFEMNHSFPQLEDVHNVLKRSVCKPNQEFQSECNACKCASNGLSYTCTHNECMEGETNREVEVFMENEGTDHVEKHSVCKPRGTFYIGCNTCHCNYYGTDYSCTNNPCPLPEDVELFHELKAIKSAKNDTNKIVCVANRMFIKDCNTCWCNEDGTSYFCTRRVCVSPDDSNDDEEKPEELRVIMKECRPDEVFELGCNMCRCNPDGKSFSCTRRACVEPVDEEQKNSTISRKTRGVTQMGSKNCQPGQEFRMDCNQCLCDNEGQEFSCTRIDCNGQNNDQASASARTKRDAVTSTKVEMKCVPGSVFDKECNVCRCTSDGGHAVCTNKRCSIPASNQEDDKTGAPEVDPNFRCNPGEQFKRGCKDCSCSADGKSIYCTVRYCDQDITPTPSSQHQKK